MKLNRILAFMLISMLIINIFSPITAAAAKKEDSTKESASTEENVSKKESASKKEMAKLWPKGPSVDADSAILMDLSTGLILYEKNSHKEQYPASITKIMTTLLAVENCSLGEIVTFSHDSVFGIEPGSSHIGIDEGEKLTIEQCLYAIMLASANEVSWGVGEHIAGSLSDFSAMMNKRAKELGCLNTHFVNANGLHDDEHYTSAYDMALISRQAMKYPLFRKVTATKRYTIPPTNKHDVENIFPNHHQMLNGYKYPQYEYEYCIGGKTGYTTKAASTLVTFAEKDGVQLVCVVMRANGAASPKNEYTDTTSLFNFGFENYKKYDLQNMDIDYEDSPMFATYSPLFNPKESPLKLSENACVFLPNSAKFEDAEQSIAFYDNLTLKEGENVIGQISYTYAGKIVGSVDILYEKKSFPTLSISQKTKVVDDKEIQASNHLNLKPIIIIVICIILALCIWLYFHFRNKRRESRKFDLRF